MRGYAIFAAVLFLFCLLGSGCGPDAETLGVMEGLKSEDSNVRYKAAEDLGRRRARGAEEALAESLTDKNAWVRRAAAWALGQIGSSKGEEGLVAALEDSDHSVGVAAAVALWQMDSSEEAKLKAAKTLGRNFQNPDWEIRWATIVAMGQIGPAMDERLLAGFESGLQDTNETVRKASVEALRKVGTAKALEMIKKYSKD